MIVADALRSEASVAPAVEPPQPRAAADGAEMNKLQEIPAHLANLSCDDLINRWRRTVSQRELANIEAAIWEKSTERERKLNPGRRGGAAGYLAKVLSFAERSPLRRRRFDKRAHALIRQILELFFCAEPRRFFLLTCLCRQLPVVSVDLILNRLAGHIARAALRKSVGAGWT